MVMILFCIMQPIKDKVMSIFNEKSRVVECHTKNETIVIKLGIMKIDFQ